MADIEERTGLDEVLITDELNRRPSRSPDFEAENEAFRELAATMASSPERVLQRLAEVALQLTKSDSAGVNLLEPGGDSGVFRWSATAGPFAPPAGGTVDRDASPCGEVITRNEVLLFQDPGRIFVEMSKVEPKIQESLLAPFLVEGRPFGTVWANKHRPDSCFDREDARVLVSLAQFASAAHQMGEIARRARNAAAELKASRDLLRATMNASTDMIQVFEAIRDEAGEIVDFRRVLDNQTSETRLGEFRGESLLESTPGVVDEGIFEDFKRVAETGEAVQAERRYVHEQLDGWYFQSVVKVGDGVAATTKDITGWKEAQQNIFRLQEEVAEARLHESEERYRSLFETMDEGFCVIEKVHTAPGEPSDYRYLTVNPAFERHTGLRDVVGRTIRELVPHTGGAILDRYDEVVATGIPAHFEDCIEAMNLWVEVNASPALVSGQVAVLFSNISARKRIELALRESEARSRGLVEGIAQAIWEAAPDGDIVSDSPSWRAHTGQSTGEGRGWGWLSVIHPDDRARTEREWREALAAGCNLDVEYRFWHAAAGEWRWSNARAVPLLDSYGSVEKWVGINIDIDDRKRTEEALREREERIRHFVEASQDVMWIRDAETMQWRYLTPAFDAVYGMSREEALAGDNYQVWLNLVIPEDRDLAVESMHRVRGGEQLSFQYRIRRPSDGQIRWLRNTDFPIREPDGTIRRIGGIGEDVTERRQAVERLRESEDRQRFLLSLSDSLRPLAHGNEITSATSEALAHHLGVAQVGYAEVCPDGESAEALAGWSNGRVPGLVDGPVPFADLGRVGEDLLDGREVVVEDVLKDARTMRTPSPSPETTLAVGAIACLPVVRGGRLVAYLFATHDKPRHWPERDIRLLHEVAERTWAALERARAETMLREGAERQRLLVAELQHRVRNILTVVRSVFSRTMETDGSAEEVAQHFIGRLDSLARTQVLVTQSASGLVDLEDMIRDELLSVGAGDSSAVSIEGPEILLRPKEAETLGLAVHELTTNALKYGAFKVPGASLRVFWSIGADEGGKRRLKLKWLEQGVPAVELHPTRYGFGSELIKDALPYRLNAETTLEFRGGGVQCTISVPLEEDG